MSLESCVAKSIAACRPLTTLVRVPPAARRVPIPDRRV